MNHHDDREESEIRWKLVASVHDQGATLAAAESRLDQAEAGIEKAGAGIARIRGILQRLGVSTLLLPWQLTRDRTFGQKPSPS